MRIHLVYDLPTRLFHWLFAGTFLAAFSIAKTADEDSVWFNYHSLAGLTLAFLVALRILWGLIGTKHARFSDFALRPKELVSYFKGVVAGKSRRWAGHNPATSWAVAIMFALAVGLMVTGVLMTSIPNKKMFEEAHEFFANGFIVVVVLHVAGIVLHTVRHQEMIGLSMVDGRKADVAHDQIVASAKSAVGVLLVGLVVVFAVYLFNSYDSEARSLKVFGVSLQLSESHEVERDDD
jgi:cytochrome b